MAGLLDPEDRKALSADLELVRITVESRDSPLHSLDVAEWMSPRKDDEPLASLADERPDFPAGPPPTLELKAFGKPFSVEAHAASLEHALAFGYSVAGWTLFGEMAGEARRSAARLGPGVRDTIEQAIVRTEQSLGALAGSYLLSLEAAAQKLLDRVLAERIGYCDATLEELIDATGGAAKFKRDDDGRPVLRARRIVADMEGIRLIDGEIDRVRHDNAPAELFVRAIQLIKLAADPFPTVLGDLPSPPAWTEAAASLVGLDEAALAEQMREPRARVSAAVSISCALRTKLIVREPWLADVVAPFFDELPVGEEAIAERVAAAIAEMRSKCTVLKEALAARSLTVRERLTLADSSTYRVAPVLELYGYYEPGRHPEEVLAGILDGGALSPAPMLPSAYTLWNLAPLVTRADRDLRAAGRDERMAALLAAVLPELRQQRIGAQLRKSAKDAGFGLFLCLGMGLSGPFGVMFAALNILLSAAEAVMTLDKLLLETTIEKADLAGAHATLGRLLDHSPDVLELVYSAINVTGSVMSVFPRLKQLEKALNTASLGLAGHQVGLTLLALAVAPDAPSPEGTP